MVIEVKPRNEKNSLTYTVQNFVVKSILAIEKDLDLPLLTNNLDNSQYDKSRFPGLFVRFSNPKCVVIIFRNGKLILTGLKSSNNIEIVLKYYWIFWKYDNSLMTDPYSSAFAWA